MLKSLKKGEHINFRADPLTKENMVEFVSVGDQWSLTISMPTTSLNVFVNYILCSVPKLGALPFFSKL